MKLLKNNLKLFIGILIGFLLAGGIVYAAVSAGQINYTTSKNVNITNVEEALNDLYTKTNTGTSNSLTVKKSNSVDIAWNGTQSDNISVSHEVTKKCNYVCIAAITNSYYSSNPVCSVSGTQLNTPVLSNDTTNTHLKIGYGTANAGETITAAASASTTQSYCKLHCFILTDE